MKIRTIVRREYESIEISDDLADQANAITHKEVEALLKFDQELSIRVVDYRFRSVRFLNYCGVIKIGQLTIEILPKIASADSAPNNSFDRRLLLRMISLTDDLPFIDTHAANVNLDTLPLIEYFINLFCDELFKQFHKGLIHTYEIYKDNISLIKGKWLVAEDLNVNVGRMDTTHCEFDNFTTDNSYNQVIKFVVGLLTKLTRGNVNLNHRLRMLFSTLSEVSDRVCTSAEVRALPRNRLVSRYETIFRLCDWFLAGYSPNIHAGDERMFGLLFNMNLLFERFIAKTLMSVLPEGYVLRAQGPQFYLAQELDSQEKRFLMKPDICIIDSNGRIAAIIDTKWKLINSRDAVSKYDVQQSDMYQLRTYADAYHCDNVALWYPFSDQTPVNCVTTYQFLRLGNTITDSNLAINAIDLQATNGSLTDWKTRVLEQTRMLLLGLLHRPIIKL